MGQGDNLPMDWVLLRCGDPTPEGCGRFGAGGAPQGEGICEMPGTDPHPTPPPACHTVPPPPRGGPSSCPAVFSSLIFDEPDENSARRLITDPITMSTAAAPGPGAPALGGSRGQRAPKGARPGLPPLWPPPGVLGTLVGTHVPTRVWRRRGTGMYRCGNTGPPCDTPHPKCDTPRPCRVSHPSGASAGAIPALRSPPTVPRTTCGMRQLGKKGFFAVSHNWGYWEREWGALGGRLSPAQAPEPIPWMLPSTLVSPSRDPKPGWRGRGGGQPLSPSRRLPLPDVPNWNH